MAGRPREFDIDEALEKALNVFRQKGFEGASLPDLTEAMGINRPSMYSAFGNKEELFRKALDRYTEKGNESLRTALAAPTAREGVKNIFYGMADGTLCNKTPKGCLLVHGALACSEEAENIREELAARRAVTEKILKERFEKSIKDGDLPKSTDAAGLAAFVGVMMHGMAVRMTSGANRDELRSIADIALKTFPSN